MELKEYSEEIDLRKYWLVLKRRWLPGTAVFSAVMGLAAFAALSQKPTYEASGKLLVKTERTSSLTGLDVNIGQLESLGSTLNKDPLNTQAEIIQSAPIFSQALKELNSSQPSSSNLDAEQLAKRLKVKAVPGTDVLQIEFRSVNPDLAAAVVNNVMQAYIENNVGTNRAEAVSARQFIEEQLPETEAAVRRAEAKLSQFKEQNRIVDLEQEAAQTVTGIGSLNTQIDQTQAQLADVTAQLQELRRQIGLSPEVAASLTVLAQSPGVQEALSELQTVQSQLAAQRARYQPTHPTITNLERQASSLNQLLQQRIAEVLKRDQQVAIGDLQMGELKQNLISTYVESEITRAGLTRRLQELSGLRSTYGQRANTFPSLEKTQRELERQLKAAQTTYEALLTKLQEVQVAENQNVGNARVIEAAQVPDTAISSRMKLLLAAGGVAGVLAGIAAAFLLDLFDQSVKTVKESRELFGYTLLGVIPAFNKIGKLGYSGSDSELGAGRVVARDFPHSPIQGAYQMLQANLKFLQSDRELKTITITSSVPGEGKSEVASNLAATIAQVGRRVLLVDADLRNPSLHRTWDVANSIGLSHVIVGQSPIEDAVQTVMPNLDVLTSGVIPPNPVALLDSNRMATLIAQFADQYDFVIFDTPPIVAFADASILGRMADGTLMVVRPGVVNVAGATAAREALTRSGQNVLGMVANAVDVRSEPDSYFYYTRDYVKSHDRKPELVSVADPTAPNS